jgi:hypothetical protein
MPGAALEFGALYFTVARRPGPGVPRLCANPPRSRRIFCARPASPGCVAVLMTIMILTHFLALAQAETAYMIAVKRLSILFGILLGAWVFREARLRQHLFAAGAMVAGWR